MTEMKEYLTLKETGTDAFVEKKSRFLGTAAPVHTREEAEAFATQVKKQYWDAKHNVSAYVLRTGEQHCSDDGEPQGTAGVPVLNVLLKNNVTDAAVVVTRYFGGVLLGTGGLVRAYSHGASIALQRAKILRMKPCLLLQAACTYSQYGRAAALVAEAGAVVDDTRFTDSVTLQFHMEAEKLLALETALANATAGSVQVQQYGEDFFPLEVPF
ncbi:MULTISPECIES: YigZ family protein [Caproicibacterium]|uniref:YigZ family protein n=1 Tax=Caproicibacterium argilliputei TaxID=3030016 RepID=A0AA97H076_9FIRM|nr:YigZ family protein [Caproicibacterium argilliputei]WOC31198.1 YigZ family protein [Caproicibacterium argilliputei]